MVCNRHYSAAIYSAPEWEAQRDKVSLGIREEDEEEEEGKGIYS